MRLIFFINLLILQIIILEGCVDIKDEAPKFRTLTLNLFKNDSNSRNLRTNEGFTLGIQRELIIVVQESEIFSTEPSKLTKIYDSSTTNLSTNEVSLSIPLGIPVKLFAYRYQEDFGTIQNKITKNIPVSFGKSNTFIIKEDTKSLTITLVISPNGIPGLIVEKNDNITSDGGGTSSFQISLKTHPSADVTIPINTNFSGVLLSQKNLEFTPLNWSKPQKIYLIGIENSLIKKSQNYNVIIGNIITNDYDYSKIATNDLIFNHQIVSKPILKEINPISSLINFNSPDYTFSSSKPGTIQYGGSCSSDNTSAQSDNNTITFNTLSDGEYSNCSITVTDPAGNTSDNLSVRAFTIDTVSPQLVSVTFDNGTSISSDNLSVLAGGFKVTFNEAMKASSMQVNDGSTGDIKINCNSANTLRLGADNTTTPGQNQCRELAQMSSSDNLSWTTLIRAFGNSHCPVTDNLTGTPSGTCAASLNPGTNYKLKLATGMTDLAGNALASENTTLFRTRKTPSIISTFPDNASDNTSVYLAPRFHFDSSMQPNSFIDNVSVTVDCVPNPTSGSDCGFSSSYDSTADNLTVNPTGSWPDNTTITVTIKGRNGNFPYSGIYEAIDGIFMPSDYVMNFKTSVIDNTSSDNLSHGLVAFYRFNGNANDETNNASHGTVSGATLTSGKDNISNTAYSFDGNTDKITIANNSLFNFNVSDNLSFSVWVYPKAFENLNGIFSKYQSTGDNDIYLRINDSSGGIKFGSDLGSVIIPNALKLNEWQNISITKSNGNTNFYVNGILKGNGTISWNQTTNYFSIGCDYCVDGSSDTSRFFDGKIDKLRIYNRILTSAEINLLNSSDNTTGLGEWAHWTLDDISGSDNVSSRDLTVTGTPIIDNGSWSLNENARGEYILQSGDNLDNFSLSIRFRIGTNASNYDSIFSTEESPGKEGSWQIGMSGNDMKFSSTDSSYAFTLSRNIWHHLVLTKSETNQINIYANNIHLDTLTLTNWSMSRLRVGTNRNTDNLWIGDIDDVRIYDYVLDSKDINKLYHNY